MRNINDSLIAFSLAMIVNLGWIRSVFEADLILYFVFAIILLLNAVYNVFKYNLKLHYHQEEIFYLFSILALYFWLLSTHFWIDSGADYFGQAVLLTSVVVIAFLTYFALNKKVLKLFIKFVLFFSAVLAILVIDESLFDENLLFNLGIFDDGYLTVANNIGIGLILSTLSLFYSNCNKIFLGFLTLLYLIALSVSLARGALVFSVFVILISIFSMLKFKGDYLIVFSTKSIMKYLIIGIPGAISLIYLALQVDRTRRRLIRMLDIQRELVSGGRGRLFLGALRDISESPFLGNGLGSNLYPHNLFLQVGADGGIFAAYLLLLIILFPVFIFLKKKIMNYEAFIFLGPYIFLVLEYSKSYNFYTSRHLFIFAVMSIWTVNRSVNIFEKGKVSIKEFGEENGYANKKDQ